MHIPNGFLDAKTIAVTSAASAGILTVSLKKTKAYLEDKQIPLISVVAAFVFAAQMLNFPIAAGTSGHFLGAVFAAILLGPWEAFLVMTLVLSIQCFVFQDGGLTALGANIFNMGVVGVFAGFLIYFFLRRLKIKLSISAFIASWASVVMAAGITALELAISGTTPLIQSLTAMVSFHCLIGLGEGFITVAALSVIFMARPDLLKEKAFSKKITGLVAGLLITAFFAALVLSPFASSLPDGLEKVAHNLGFISKEAPSNFSVISDYQFPWVKNKSLATSIAAGVGVLAVLAVGSGFFLVLRGREDGA